MSSCVNPLIYAATIPAFKEFIKGVLFCESSGDLDNRVKNADMPSTAGSTLAESNTAYKDIKVQKYGKAEIELA